MARRKKSISMGKDAEQIEDLRLFLRQMDIIRELGMVNKPSQSISFHLKFSKESGVTTRIEGLPVDEFRSLMTGIRQFYMPGEKVNFGHIYNILEEQKIPENLLEWVRGAKEKWDETLKSILVSYYHGNKALFVNYVMDLYFYSQLAHSDPKRIAEWDDLDALGQSMALNTIRKALPTLLWSLSTVDTIVDTWLNHPERDIPPYRNGE